MQGGGQALDREEGQRVGSRGGRAGGAGGGRAGGPRGGCEGGWARGAGGGLTGRFHANLEPSSCPADWGGCLGDTHKHTHKLSVSNTLNFEELLFTQILLCLLQTGLRPLCTSSGPITSHRAQAGPLLIRGI